MGCGASQPIQPPKGNDASPESPKTATFGKATFEKAAPSEREPIFRGLNRLSASLHSPPRSLSLLKKGSGRSSTSSSPSQRSQRALRSKRASLGESADNLHVQPRRMSTGQITCSYHGMTALDGSPGGRRSTGFIRPSTRSDAVINKRSKGLTVKRRRVAVGANDGTGDSASGLAVPKDEETTSFLHKAALSFTNTTLFRGLSEVHLKRLIRAMIRVELKEGEFLIKQGDSDEDTCFILGKGCTFNVIVDGEVKRACSEGECVGEVALLYGAARTASICAIESSHAWKLNRAAFQLTARELSMARTETVTEWLRTKFPFFGDAKLMALRHLALTLRPRQLAAGELLPTGEDMVYLVEKGSLAAADGDTDVSSHQVYAVLGSQEGKVRLRAQELHWRQQRHDFIDAQEQQSKRMHEASERSHGESLRGESSITYIEHTRPLTIDAVGKIEARFALPPKPRARPATFKLPLPMRASISYHGRVTMPPRETPQEMLAAGINEDAIELPGITEAHEGSSSLKIEAFKMVRAGDRKTLNTATSTIEDLKAGPEGAWLLCVTPKQWSTLVGKMYRLYHKWASSLRHQPPFSLLDSTMFDALYKLLARQRTYEAGAVIICEGEPSSTIFLLVDGELAVGNSGTANAITSERASGQQVHTEHRGFLFGDHKGEPAVETVRATKPCVCAILEVDKSTPPELLESVERLLDTAKRRTAELSLDDLSHVTDLGGGGYGTVVLMKNKKDNTPVAVKVLLRHIIAKRRQCAHVMSEKKLMVELRHPFIVELYATFKDSKRLFMAMEYVIGGELWSILSDMGTLNEKFTRFLVGSVVMVIEHIHSRKFVYRDMKPENLMIGHDGHLKLIDFGFCKQLADDERTFTACGTVEYMAPEIVSLKGHEFAVDYWSIGVLMYECMHSYTPFSSKGNESDDLVIIKAIRNEQYDIEYDPIISPNGVALMRDLFTHEPTERPNASVIRNHAYFENFSWEALLSKQMEPPHVPKFQDPFDASNFEPDIDPGLTGPELLGLQADPYTTLDEWDVDF